MSYVMDNLRACSDIIVAICSYVWVKVAVAAFFIVGGFFFDTLHQQALIAILILVIMDFVTAMVACLRCEVGIHSRGVFRSALKIAIYFLLVSAGFMAEKAIPVTFIDETIMAFLATTELISILENISKAGFATPTGLLGWLKEFNNRKPPTT